MVVWPNVAGSSYIHKIRIFTWQGECEEGGAWASAKPLVPNVTVMGVKKPGIREYILYAGEFRAARKAETKNRLVD